MSDVTLDLTKLTGLVTIAQVQSAYRARRSETGQHSTAVMLTPVQLGAMLASAEQRQFMNIRAVGAGYEILGLAIELARDE
jgi:hypothetical protein